MGEGHSTLVCNSVDNDLVEKGSALLCGFIECRCVAINTRSIFFFFFFQYKVILELSVIAVMVMTLPNLLIIDFH